LTPHLDFRNDYLSPNEQELRKVSDSLGRPRFYQHQSAGGLSGGGFDMTQGLGLDPHPQPNGFFFNRTVAGDHFALSAERGDAKPPFSSFQAETEYERQREHNIQDNQKLLENLGVGGGGGHASVGLLRVSKRSLTVLSILGRVMPATHMVIARPRLPVAAS
jgi:hypothetical protein